ncbi:MAG TPA: ferrous iron transport protein B [Anaerolineae bacterium]|nr:ferrous iron transport protein B [Anaerolineae bacterium]HQH37765.1 ferrous iron transport protein B [Anaerolineae bacterium]
MRYPTVIETAPARLSPVAAATITVALAGQPNVGKSTIFNALTGLNQHVGNWPGKTVEQKTGSCTYRDRRLNFVDLPGTYSLTANSMEERIARDYILHERPDGVVAVVDSAIPERSLYLLAELLQLPTPVVLVLNMMDVATQEGVQVEPQVLQAALGIPVVPMCATKNQGLQEMLDALIDLVEGKFPYNPRRPVILPAHQRVLEQLITLIADHVPAPYPADWVALKLLEGDGEMVHLMQETLPRAVWEQVHSILYQHEDAILDIAGARYAWIARMTRAAVVRPRVGPMGLTARLDRVLTHPLWGMVALLGVLACIFGLTYAIGVPLQEGLDGLIQHLVRAVHDGLHGVPHWLVDLLSDGLLGGAGMVITFLPILVIFFAALGFLEDTGYMARAAYNADRFMHALGLHGKSFMPLLLGFGCNVPAILGTRIIETQRARWLTILLAPLIPCTARMAVIAVLAPVFFGEAAAWVAWGLVAVNLGVLAVVGIVFHRLVLKGEPAMFIMELPLYHLPNARTIGLYVWQNVVAFLRKAGTVILAASVAVWLLSYFPADGDVTQSYLAWIGRALTPLGKAMGLPWPLMVALLTSFVAKENTIATLGVLYGDFATVLPTLLTPSAALGFLVVQMLFIPCVATVAAIRQETQSWRWTAISVGLMLTLSLTAGVLVYQVGALL